MIAGRLSMLVLLCITAQALAPALADAGEDSPWPDTEALRPNVRAVEREVGTLEDKVELMEQTVERHENWEQCVSWVPVSEYGDPDRRFGYRYDEHDGTAAGYRPALAVDRRSRPGREDYMFLDFAAGPDCESAAPRSGGTADSASVATPAPVTLRSHLSRGRPGAWLPLAAQTAASTRGLSGQVGRLERKVLRMKRLSRGLDEASERFDEWESCVSWVPVTEYGDPDRKFGYAFSRTTSGATTPGYRAALTIDRSDWDDPDYMFLALVGGDRPGGTCQDEPGEAVD